MFKRFFHRANVKQKLTAIIMLTSTLVLLLSLTAFIVVEVVSFRQTLLDKSTSLARIIGANSKLALAYRDKQSAGETLESLAAEGNVQAAFLFDHEDKPFAQYLRAGASAEPLLRHANHPRGRHLHEMVVQGRDAHLFTLNSLSLVHTIELDRQRVGTLFLQSDLSLLYQRLLWFGVGALGVFGFSVLLAYFIGYRLQQVISVPLTDLSRKMNQVSRHNNFSLRMEKQTEDEIGELIEGFNEMLTQIEARDDQLALHRRNLEQQVAERTRDLEKANERLTLTIEDLECAKAGAEEANRAKSRFLANMSHEIRTPMIGVMGMADLLLKTPLNERQKGLAETIHKSGDALLSILNDILDFSKIEAGRLELETVDFDLCHCIEDAVELLSPKAFAKGLELVCIVDDRMPVHLRGDAGRMRQVVLNLVGNAVKFTTRGEIVVRVDTLMEERSTVWVRFEVRDSGIGIPEDVQGRIFDSFSQADTSTSRHFGGTGLGLSIVRQLVEMMGGRIGLESKPGEGSLFWVHLRLEKQPVESRSEVYEILRFPGKKALVATGHAAFGQALVERLAAHGVDALHAGSVQAARSKVESGHNEVSYDLILVDEQLPDGEGIALCRDLHAANSPGASLVLLSTPRTGYGEETLQEAGVVASLSKPIRRENLKKVLHRVFDAPAESGMSPAAENIRKIRPSGAKHQILVAEDNPTTQRLIELLFEDSPYHVRIVPDGMQAVHAVKDNRFDLVLMDCQMPGLDGFEATREIRAGGANLPVIALTAHVGREEVERCREVGMNDYLRKPFKQEELFLMLEKWLSADVAEGKRCIFSTASLS